MLGILKSAATTASAAFRRPVTVQYPDQTRKLPGRNRGLPLRCGLCEEVCPTDQERYGYQKAIVLGTGHLSIQSSVYDRSDNVLDLDRLTYHSRVLKLELNAVMGTKPPKEDLLVNSPQAAGLRLEGPAGLSLDGAKPRLMRDRSLPTATRFSIRWLKLYSRFWLLKRGLPLRSKPQTNGEAPSGEADSSADGG
jgi:formate hydrogenlyase subunit 6/NADH:ubiquinone oxidoreductase subunit I